MRYTLPLILLTFLLSFLFYSCQKDESNPVDNNNFSAKGSEYLPLSSGDIYNIKVTGTAIEYNQTGQVISYTTLNHQLYNGNVGTLTYIKNMNAHPIIGHDASNSKLLCYLANNNDEIVAFDETNNSEIVLVLPAQLTIGKEWIANPQSPANKQAKIKLLEVLNNYTNAEGNSYQNVINVSATYKDSSNYGSGYYNKTSANLNIYLAKGIGIVGINLINYEEILVYYYYKRTVASGTLALVN